MPRASQADARPALGAGECHLLGQPRASVPRQVWPASWAEAENG